MPAVDVGNDMVMGTGRIVFNQTRRINSLDTVIERLNPVLRFGSIAFAGSSFSFGVYYGQRELDRVFSFPITVEEGLKILHNGRDSHQYFLDHPEDSNDKTGDLTHHKRWVERYDQLEHLIIELKKVQDNEHIDQSQFR